MSGVRGGGVRLEVMVRCGMYHGSDQEVRVDESRAVHHGRGTCQVPWCRVLNRLDTAVRGR